MRTIKIFLASSINEFKDERNEIGDLIRRIQDKLIDKNIRIKLFECEFFDNSISNLGRKQNDYNEENKTSDIFIMLIGKRLGNYTKEEYEVASKSKKPQLNIVFKNVESDISVSSFKQEIISKSNINIYKFFDSIELMSIINDIVYKYIENNIKAN